MCCAFALIKTAHGIAPLVRARADELQLAPGATTIPTTLIRDVALLHRALSRLIDDALDQSGRLTLDRVFGSSVDRQGRRGEAPTVTATGFDVNGTHYASRSAVVAAAIESLRYGSLNPDGVHDTDQPENDYLPLLGATTLLGLLAYLDCYDAGDDIHAHWGAISMSGYPPVTGGYFGRRATRRTLRDIGTALSTMPEFDFTPRFALLPAPILSLLPPREFDTDCELVSDLVTSVLATERPRSDPSAALDEITELVRRWLGDNRRRLTPYYLNRFGLARSVFNGTSQVPEDGTPYTESLLADLTMRQATMLLGALIEQAKRIPDGGAA